MISVEQLAEKLAISINKKNPNSSSIIVLRYALVSLINLIIIMGFIIIVGLVSGRIVEAVVAVVAFPALRYFSGGLHLRSSMICNIISAIFMLISIYAPLHYWYTGFIINLISFSILFLYAPSGVQKSKISKSQYPMLKLVALLIVSSNLIFHSPVLSIAFFAQSITTIPKFADILDRTNW